MYVPSNPNPFMFNIFLYTYQYISSMFRPNEKEKYCTILLVFNNECFKLTKFPATFIFVRYKTERG